MKIAVTGANGFVGSNLANHFQRLGHEVVAIVRPKSPVDLIDPAIAIRRTDYQTGLDEALNGVEILIHNAGAIRARSFAQMVAANVGTTRRVMAAFNRSETGRRLVYISSQAASHPSRGNEEVCESEPSAPVDWYGRSKLLAERIIRAECIKEWVVARPVPVYGPGEKDFLQLFKAVKAGISFQIGRREQYLNLIYIDELCAFVELCCTQPQAAGEVFFASNGQTYTHREFMAACAHALGKKQTLNIAIPVPLAVLGFHAGELFEALTGKVTLVNKQKMKELINVNWVCGIAKARKLLGWDPRPDLEANLRKTFAWYREHGWL
ncbi:MAG: NAD-dependent epimerase/dehydratase family protein [Candidatus Cloacimonetes bacterium]|nr:NAD-dependent epimerase/dehydratase family protein [Candidatus Cloacimonadota bacterium]